MRTFPRSEAKPSGEVMRTFPRSEAQPSGEIHKLARMS
jgi:hypothetical protein